MYAFPSWSLGTRKAGAWEREKDKTKKRRRKAYQFPYDVWEYFNFLVFF
jgi:hypothetical protein